MNPRKGFAGATYIDFEGNIDWPPTLLGVLSPGADGADDFREYVLESAFARCADREGCEAMDLEGAITRLVEDAERRELEIVAWGKHELETVERYVPPPLARRFKARFRDAKETGKRWLRRCHAGVTPPRSTGMYGHFRGRHTLQWYEEFVGSPSRPSVYLSWQTGPRITRVRAALERHDGQYAALPRGAKRAWSLVLGRNSRDCSGLKFVDESVRRSDGSG